VLVGGALVNSFRGELEGEMFDRFDTPLGTTLAAWLFHLAAGRARRLKG
jgi:hypothetical protein